MIFNILLWLLTLKRKGVNDVAVIYALLIIKGKKTLADVPAKLRDQVREILIDMEVPAELTE